MNARHAAASRSLPHLVISIVLAAIAVTAGLSACGGSGKASANAAPSTVSPSGSPLSIVGRTTAEGARLPSTPVMDALEGRIAAMNERDGEAAAAFYAEDGVLEETDLTPHGVSRGRAGLAIRFDELYDMGLRLAPAGAPIANGRYVAEPTRFYNGGMPGRGAGMLVFEVDAQNQFAYQWMIGWAGGPEKTFDLVKSPSVRRPNLPPRGVRKILDAHMAAVNDGDGQATAALYAQRGVLEETSQHPGLETKGRENIAVRARRTSRRGPAARAGRRIDRVRQVCGRAGALSRPRRERDGRRDARVRVRPGLQDRPRMGDRMGRRGRRAVVGAAYH